MTSNKLCFLIDDDEDDQEIFIWAIKEAGIKVQLKTALNGQDALEMLEADRLLKPDYIFLDLNMPVMSGKQFLAEFKKIERFRSTPVYIYSTSSQEKDRLETEALGATDFIVKPSSVDTLVTVLTNIIK